MDLQPLDKQHESANQCQCKQLPLKLSPSVRYCQRCMFGWSSQDDYSYEEFETDISRRLTCHRIGLVARSLGLGKRLLDFGCGSGSFLNEAKRYWTCEGVEADHTTIDLAKRSTDLPIRYSLDHDLRYDCITFFDSLEYLFSIHANFAGLLENLNPGGIVVITMPELQFCFDSTRDEAYLSRVFSEWPHAERGQSSYFSKNGLERFVKRAGLTVMRVDNDESELRVCNINPRTNVMTMVACKS